MKRFCLFVFAVASMLLAASCQQELNPVTDGDTTVTFTVNAGDVATRAIADGTNVDALHWEIYKTDDLANAVQPLGEKTIIDKDANKEFTVELKLLADQKYTIIFWAEVDGADHYITTDLRNVAIKDYSDEDANDESRAAFFRVYPFETENGETITETIELYRPFSQINLGSTTYETSFNNVNGGNVEVETSEMTVTKIATSFNTLTGKGEGEQVVTFKAHATPNAPEDDTQKLLEVNDLYYYWLGMNYLIVCGDSDNVDVDITLDTNFGEVKHTISSVPVKENYRTNLLGNFLTTDATFTVVVDEDFEVPDIVIGENWTQTGSYEYSVNAGAAESSLEEILKHADAAAKEAATKADGPVVTINLNGNVFWATGAGHGSTPLLPADSPISAVVINGNGNTLTATGSGVGSIRLANGSKLALNNVNVVDESVSYAESAWEFTYLEFAGVLEFNGCTFNSGVQFQTEDEEAVLNATFSECRFISNESSVYAAWISDGTTVFEGCTFEGTRGLKMHEDYGSEIASVVVDGCTFGPLEKKPGVAIGTLNAETSVTIKNSTFNKCQAGDQGNYIYETDTDVNTFDFTLEGNTVIAGGDEVIEQEDESLVVSTAAALRAALAANYATVPTIKLADGVYEGLFYVNGKSLNIEALNEGMAKIDGKLAIAASGKTVNVKGIVFENAYSGDVKAGHQYLDKTGTYCIGLYCASVNVENCTFNLSKDGGINFYSFNAPERCTVKNSTFNANGFRPIISKANLTVEGCTFNDQNKYALQVWGNQNTGSETVVFQNNTIVDPGKTSGVASGLLSYVSISKSYAISNVAFTIEGNTPGYHFIYDDDAKVKITECSLNGNSIVSRQCVAIDGVTDAKEVVIDYVPTTEYVSSAAELKVALDDKAETIVLMPGTYEGSFTAVASTLQSYDAADKAVIKGRVECPNSNVVFKDIKFDYNETSKTEFSSSIKGNPSGHPAIVGVYGGEANAVTFENCEFVFKSGYNVDKAPGAITHYGGVKLTLKDCVLDGNGNPIYAKTNVEMTGCTVKMYGNNAVLSLNYADPGYLVFKNNTVENKSTDSSKTYAVQFLSTNAYKKLYVDIQGNTGVDVLAAGASKVTDIEYASGSEKF